jgi:hypothetical protein
MLKKTGLLRVKALIASTQAYLLEEALSDAEEAYRIESNKHKTILEASKTIASMADKELRRKKLKLCLLSLQKQKEELISSHLEAVEDASFAQLELCEAQDSLCEIFNCAGEQCALAEKAELEIEDKVAELQVLTEFLVQLRGLEVCGIRISSRT